MNENIDGLLVNNRGVFMGLNAVQNGFVRIWPISFSDTRFAITFRHI
jgi:hypothetical protein